MHVGDNNFLVPWLQLLHECKSIHLIEVRISSNASLQECLAEPLSGNRFIKLGLFHARLLFPTLRLLCFFGQQLRQRGFLDSEGFNSEVFVVKISVH